MKHRDQEVRLHIGESNRLQRRVSYCVKGAGPHSACERIRANEHVPDLQVRWAVTEQHQETEWQLLEAHEERFGKLPVYTRMKGRLGSSGRLAERRNDKVDTKMTGDKQQGRNEPIKKLVAITHEKTTLLIVQRVAHALVDAIETLPFEPESGVPEDRILEHLHGIIEIVEKCYAPDPDDDE